MDVGRIFIGVIFRRNGLGRIFKLHPNWSDVDRNQMGIGHVFDIQRTLIVIAESCRPHGAAVINSRRIRVIIAVINGGSFLG